MLKALYLLDNTTNQTSKLTTKIWVEKKDDVRRTYSTNSQIKFKTTMWMSSFCDYSDACILPKWTITLGNTAAANIDVNNTNKKANFKNCASFTDCLSAINNTLVDNAKHIDVTILMHNLLE